MNWTVKATGLIIILFSCSKNDDTKVSQGTTPATTPFQYSDSFYTYPRTMVYRENFDSLGMWTFFSMLNSTADWCNEGIDTSVATVMNGDLVIMPDELDHNGVGYTQDIFAQLILPSLPITANQPYGIEIKFKEFFQPEIAGSVSPGSEFLFAINGTKIQTDTFPYPAYIDLDGQSLHICMRNDTILGVINSPVDTNINPPLPLMELIATDTASGGTNKVWFRGSFFDTGISGCKGQNTIVEYFEIYTFP